MSKYLNTIKVDNVIIGDDFPTYFIADIAANHDGSIDRAIKLIKLAKECGANAVKFQHFDAKTIVSDYGFKNLGCKASHQEKWKKSVYEVYEESGVPVKRFLYKSEYPFAWSAGMYVYAYNKIIKKK